MLASELETCTHVCVWGRQVWALAQMLASAYLPLGPSDIEEWTSDPEGEHFFSLFVQKMGHTSISLIQEQFELQDGYRMKNGKMRKRVQCKCYTGL